MARDGERGRGDWKARLGSQNSGPYAEDSGDTGPVDIAAVRRDDALIDAIAGDGTVSTGSDEEYQLATLLASWRADIVDEPLPAGPDLDDIVAAVNQEIGARQARVNATKRGHLRLVRPLMGAAAAVALIAGGMTAFSYNAEPGDPLWKVKEVVFSQQAQTTIAQNAQGDMAKAQDLIAAGHPDQAKSLLASAQAGAGQISDSARKKTLTNQWNQVWTALHDKAPEIAASLLPSGVPVPTLPNSVVLPTTLPSWPSGGHPSSGTTSTTRDPRLLQGTAGSSTSPQAPVSTVPGGNTVQTNPSSTHSNSPTTVVPPTTRPGGHEPTGTVQPSSAPTSVRVVPTMDTGPTTHQIPTGDQMSTGNPIPTENSLPTQHSLPTVQPVVPTVHVPTGGGFLPGGGFR
ncbi:anti-sigma-D factor RsdA [Nocardia miyunensis]|uniref:anti-sigma-D factor RsdA n=1 Tax=Nocardia miyunensis TaxID=282684 RepID=UPI000AD8E51A|nr:anti-sigma-D factor RsdA [Nocardia miyunensis]